MLIAIQILFLLYNASTAIYQARLFNKGKKINHAVWAAVYLALVAGVGFWQHNWMLCAACLVLRMPVFNTVLNYARSPRKPFFYVGEASAVDRLVSKFYPVAFFLSIAILITLEIILL